MTNVAEKWNKEIDDVQAIGAEAFEVARSYSQEVIQPEAITHLYRPMKFRKLRGKEHAIEPAKGECWEVSTFRHSLLFGVKRFGVNFGKAVTFHELHGPRGKSGEGDDSGTGLLTSDKPIEIWSQYIEFHKMRGHVLVGGLGLGMAAEMILKMASQVLSVTVVEINTNLIKLIQPQIDERIEIVHADLFEYLEQQDRLRPQYRMKYDSAYFDIWYGTGESTWQSTVVPLYRAARKIGIDNLGAWGEHEMRGQMVQALFSRSRMKEEFSAWKPYSVFIAGAKKEFGSAPPWNGEYKDDVVGLIKLYIEQVGSEKWESTFDWEAVQ